MRSAARQRRRLRGPRSYFNFTTCLRCTATAASLTECKSHGASDYATSEANSVKICDYCRSSIFDGQRWVRQKIYNPQPDGSPAYRHYHAEPFPGQNESCWEKHQMERELARKAA
jgi:hypothetical protein